MMKRAIEIAAMLFVCSCVAEVKGTVVTNGDDDDDMGSGSDSPPPPPPPGANGIVQSPLHGSVVGGDPKKQTVHVGGVATAANEPLAIQVLSNPDDLMSWTTIAMATSGEPATGGYAFAADIEPATDNPERWPRGGVLRIRVIDSHDVALPHDEDLADTVVAVTNPSLPPLTWTYLTEKGIGFNFEADLYYQKIDAPSTLGGFASRYGFVDGGNGEAFAAYYNLGDLGIGREMHCQSQANGGLACYVRNFGTFGGLEAEAIIDTVQGDAPFATVAMVYTPPITDPNSVAFMVYDANNNLQDFAKLDVLGQNQSVPENCLACHGGKSSYDRTTHEATGARFLAFDPDAFHYAPVPGFRFNDQDEQFGKLDRLIANAAPTPGVKDFITGIYPAANFVADYIPDGWTKKPGDKTVYRNVIAPYCRSCHLSQSLADTPDPLMFLSAAETRNFAGSIKALICGKDRAMPEAAETAVRFFNSGARGELLAWLNAPGACAP